MTAEKFLMAMIRSEFLLPKKLTFKAENIYYESLKPVIDRRLKQGLLKPQKREKKKYKKNKKGGKNNENIK